MIRVFNSDINNPNFVAGANKLAQTNFEFKTAYHIGRIADKINTYTNKTMRDWAEIANGLEWNVNEQGQRTSPKDAEKLTALQVEFMQRYVDIDKKPVDFNDILEAKLTPLEAIALAPILTGLEALEGNDNGSKD